MTMNNFTSIIVITFVQIVHSEVYTNNNGVQFEYAIYFKQKCRSKKGRFAFLYELSIAQCVEECGLRRHCEALNYWNRGHICELYSLAEEGDERIPGCIFIPVSNINALNSPCGLCGVGKACDTKTQTCIYKECQIPNVPENGKIHGNNYKIGGRIKYQCSNNETYGTMSNVCLTNGQWSEAVNCSKDCDSLSNITDGIVTAPATTHGATAVYTCNVDHVLTGGDTTRSCVEGTWTGIEPMCSPIPNIGCYYVESPHMYQGTRKKTTDGIICQRWDSQSPHIHTRDDPINFPDASVFAAVNYCRDPDDTGAPWCYTTDSDTRWDYCGVKQCLN